MKRLDFVVGGAQKAGTSTLFVWLRRHRDVGMAEPKELHFFDDEERDWLHPDYRTLHDRLPDHRLTCGEATPVTLYWLPAQYRLRAYREDCKLILVFRDPIERAVSHWSMIRSRGEDTLAFADAVRHGRQRVGGGSEVPGLHRLYSYVERGLYGAQLRHLLTVFPREQLLLLDFEHLAADAGQVLAQVTDFLGVSRDGFSDLSPVHANATPATVDVDDDTRAHLIEVFAADLRLFEELSGLDVSHWPSYHC